MALSISTLLAPVTAAQVRAKFVSMLNILGIPADKWRAGGVASSILTVTSMTYANFSLLVAAGVASQFLPTATGDWLTLLAQYVYNVIRQPATFAQGVVTFTNVGGGIYSFGPGEVTLQNAVTQRTYTNVNTLSIGAGSLGSPTVVANVAVIAQTAGSASSADPGDISALVTQMLGVSVTNPSSVVGLDAQSDANLVQVCQSKLGSLSVGGPSAAYQYAVDVAINPTTLLPVSVNRRSVQLAPSTGTVNVTVASASGPVSADDITGIIASIVGVAVPDAVTFAVASAVPVTYAPSITVWAQGLAGVDGATLAQQAADAITQYVEAYPIGGVAKGSGSSKLWGSGVAGAIKDVSSAIFAVDGATDLTLLANQVAVDSVPTPVVVLVPAP